MNNLEYITPGTLDEALDIKGQHGASARVIAGGTDLILRMRDKVLNPGVLIDLKSLSLDTITDRAGELHLGAYIRLSQILENMEVQAKYPALADACLPFAGPPIRNRATLGGNIVNASPAADLVPALIAYDAITQIMSSAGARKLALDEFFSGPGETQLQADEILTGVTLPELPVSTASTFIKLGPRRSMAISIVNLATRISVDASGIVSEARIVLGAVAPTPIRATDAEAVIAGNTITDDLIEQAASVARQETAAISDVRAGKEYRARMTEVVVRRALLANRDELARTSDNG